MILQRQQPWWRRCSRRLVALFAGVFAGLFVSVASAETAQPWKIAFFYGQNPDLKALAAYDQVVVEPDNGINPKAAGAGQHGVQTRWIAYVSVGEVLPSRDYYAAMPKAWHVGRNGDWQSEVVDQSAQGWPQFFVEKVIAPLWARGYRGFFLDTLDSYQLIAKDDAERARQQAGLVELIRRIHRRYPRAELILNRGFELLPEVHGSVSAVAFESLYRGWDNANTRYVEVNENDRAWLLARAREVRERYDLPVIAIDYCAPTDTDCARETVSRIREQGLIPYVGDGHLMRVNPAAAQY